MVDELRWWLMAAYWGKNKKKVLFVKVETDANTC